MSFDDDWLKPRFPTRHGIATGDANERVMAAKVDVNGIRTVIKTVNGVTTMLRTRNGFPEFTTTPAPTPAPAADEEIKGLVDNHVLEGVPFLPGDPAGDVCGETYAVTNYKLGGKLRKNALISGQNHWFNKEELGPDSWVYVDADKNCWLVTQSALAADLSTITLDFRALPHTAKTPPVRPIVQTITVTRASADTLDPEEDYPGHAYAQIEDIATNGGKVLLVNASTPFAFASAAHGVLDGPFASGRNILNKGRYVYLAVELVITGVPPAASAELTTVLTTTACRGSFTPYSGGTAHSWKEWNDLVVGLRYNAVQAIETVTQDVRADLTETITRSEVDTWTEQRYADGSWWDVTWPVEKRWYDHRVDKVVTQEGVTVSLTSRSLSDPNAPYYNVTGGGTAPGYPGTWSAYNANPPSEIAYATGVAGGATWPGGTYDGLNLASASGYDAYFFRADLQYYASNTYRPAWHAETLSGHPGVTTDFEAYGYTFNWATVGIISQKYANRVFGLQLVSIGSSNSDSAMDTAGPSISYPACMGGVYNNDVVVPLPQFVTPYLSTGARELAVPSGAQYPTKDNVYAAPTAGTSRVLLPKLVISPDNVAYVHYYK